MDRRLENESKASEVNALLEGSELTTLVDLQKFIADELSDTDSETSFARAFTPLTDGLGLTSPAQKEAPAQKTAPAARKPSVVEIFDMEPISPSSLPSIPLEERPVKFFAEEKSRDSARIERLVASQSEAETEEEEDEIKPTESLVVKSLAAAIDAPVPVASEVKPAPAPPAAAKTVKPPPVPAATFVRRFLSGLLDEVFVLTLCVVALGITASVLAQDQGGLELPALFKQLSNPMFIRFGVMEFATIWLAYLAIGVGVLDMTFGMWVWGLRVRYGTQGATSDAAFIKKIARVVLSFVFFAPIAPALLLAIRIKGKTALDWMTGAVVYRSAV